MRCHFCLRKWGLYRDSSLDLCCLAMVASTHSFMPPSLVIHSGMSYPTHYAWDFSVLLQPTSSPVQSSPNCACGRASSLEIYILVLKLVKQINFWCNYVDFNCVYYRGESDQIFLCWNFRTLQWIEVYVTQNIHWYFKSFAPFFFHNEAGKNLHAVNAAIISVIACSKGHAVPWLTIKIPNQLCANSCII